MACRFHTKEKMRQKKRGSRGFPVSCAETAGLDHHICLGYHPLLGEWIHDDV